MAKTVEELQIKLGLKGIEEIAKIKSSLRGLASTADITSKSLQEIAKGVKNFSTSGGESISVIRGQVTALKGLQSQSALNSKTFQQLGKDIAFYEAKLKKAEQTAETSQAAIRRRGTFVKATPGRFLEAEAFAASRPSVLPFDEQGGLREEFVAQQSRQNVLAEARIRLESRLQAKIQAVTKAQVDNNKKLRTAAEIVKTFGGELNQLPATTNNVQMELKELRSDLGNLVIGGEEYISTLRRINDLQRQLDINPLDPTGRKTEIRSRLGTLGRFGGETDPVAKSIARNRRRRERGALPPLMLDQPVEASGLFRTIASIGSADTKAATEMMGRSLSQVTAEINRQAAASKGSINSLQAQRAAFAQLRAGLDPTSQDFRELGNQIEKTDRQLEKLNKRRRRPTVRGIAQGLGGVAAGGVFGGPEGALGAAVGGAVGGIAGVAAGAALGAQAKMLREALGATSDYAAQLQKLEIALEGVAGAQYTDALKAAAEVTKDFNVPLAVSTKGITRLSAAVIGAGGNIEDAEVVFRNVTSAIKATGGGAQDVESAITAMVQTFSKGRVSAEELSGQLGERLPGAVTQFAEANKMTLPELQKAFKAGTVGLDELMKFIISLGPRYEETARAIADSSADAGAKAKVAFDQVRREVGEALQPIGAALQEAFAEFVLEILPAIKSGAVAAARGLNALLDASSFLIANFKELLIVAGAAGIALALQNLIGIATALGTAFGKATVAMKSFTAASLLNPWVALAAGIAAATVALVKYSKKNAEFNKSVIAGETTNKEANDRLREMNDKVKELQDRLETEGNGRMIRQLENQLKAAKIAADNLSLAMKLASTYTVAGVEYDRMSGLPIDPPKSYTPNNYDDPDSDGGGSGSTRVMMTQAELDIRNKIRQARFDENKFLESSLTYELDILTANQETEDALARANAILQAGFDLVIRGRDLRQESADQAEREAEAEARKKDRIEQARVLAGEITQEEYERKKILDEMKVLLEGMPDLYQKIKEKLLKTKEPLDNFRNGLEKIFEEAMNLKDALATQAVQAVQTLGDTFADFVATGKADFADMTKSILQDLSRIFAKAALFKGLSLIPGVGNFLELGGSASSVANAKGNVYAKNKIVPFAYGGIVNKPTIFPMAKGAGIMGEAGPEAIMPLRRGSNGKLGVEASGGVGNVVVNVDASGSRVQGDQPNAKALGSAIGAAVQAELVRQKRPGGLLS